MVDGDSLENYCRATYPGFESLSLRHYLYPKKLHGCSFLLLERILSNDVDNPHKCTYHQLLEFNIIIMSDRRQQECATVDDIARAKINNIQVRDGDPPREEVLRAVLAELQAQFQANSEAASVVPNDVNTAQAPANNEALEKLNDVERACLEAMREDFARGIVQIDENADKDGYRAALKQDKTAGQSWEAVQGRLLANEASLLKKAVELSKLTGDQEGKGACLVGVYENGELAIRQRSSEIVNAIVNKKGELRLAFHPEAQLEEGEQCAKAVGYHVPADAPDYNKRGLVAASEAVTGEDYVASPNRNAWREAMLECPDNVSDDADVRVVDFSPDRGNANVYSADADFRDDFRGAVLWLRG